MVTVTLLARILEVPGSNHDRIAGCPDCGFVRVRLHDA
jgi:hypothetical protein